MGSLVPLRPPSAAISVTTGMVITQDIHVAKTKTPKVSRAIVRCLLMTPRSLCGLGGGVCLRGQGELFRALPYAD